MSYGKFPPTLRKAQGLSEWKQKETQEMNRSIKFHQPPGYDEAALEALNWVNETGGTILFISSGDEKRSRAYFKKHQDRLIKPAASERAHAQITRGGDFLIWGPRVAAVSIDECGMSRIERDIENGSVCAIVEELRSYARNPDKHPKWTQQYNPDDLSIEM